MVLVCSPPDAEEVRSRVREARVVGQVVRQDGEQRVLLV